MKPRMKGVYPMKALTGLIGVLLVSGSAWAGAQETNLINLAKSGVDSNVLIAYIDNEKGPYHLTTDQIISLKKLGVSSNVMAAAIRHDAAQPQAAAQNGEGESNADDSIAAQVVETPAAASVPTAKQSAVQPPAPPAGVVGPAPGSPEAGSGPADSPAGSATAESTAPPPDVVAPAAEDQNISYFYQALYPYGTWVDIDGEWCWQPYAATVNGGWSPYCTNGYWTYTDCGWTWVSNYSWGWAPFHYGRWFPWRLRLGMGTGQRVGTGMGELADM